jgi:flagellar motor component MotA
LKIQQIYEQEITRVKNRTEQKTKEICSQAGRSLPTVSMIGLPLLVNLQYLTSAVEFFAISTYDESSCIFLRRELLPA